MNDLDMSRLALLLHVSESLAKQGNFPHLTSVVNSEIKQMNDAANPNQKLVDKLLIESKPVPVFPKVPA